MSLFRRRIVQRELDLLRRKLLRADQTKRFVTQLNSASRHALSAEWEIIVTSAFAKVAHVEYEPPIGTGFPDLHVTRRNGNVSFGFVADIITVSDFGTHQKYPVSFLYREILMMSLRVGVDFSTLGWQVGALMDGKFSDRKVRVMLPSKAKIHALLQTSVKPFLLGVKAEPLKQHELVWHEAGVDFRLRYNPSQRRSDFGGPLLPTTAYSLHENPLYDALRKKAKRLDKTNFNGPRGIIAVDGDCHCIRSSPFGSANSYDGRQIASHFLTKNPTIDFVTRTSCESRLGYAARGYQLNHHIHFQKEGSAETRLQLESLICAALSEIPQPAQSPRNALSDIINRKEVDRGAGLGAYEWAPLRELSVPAGVFLALITRTLSQRDFELLFYQTIPPNGGPLIRFFDGVANCGLALTRVSVQTRPDDNYDWITFEIGRTARQNMSALFTSNESCDISTSIVVRYLAGLDYAMCCGKANCSSAPAIPNRHSDLILKVLAEGRLLNSAQLVDRGNAIRLSFGSRDAAISLYA